MNVTKSVEKYVLERPVLKDSLKKGLINYSKLSRLIIKETELKPADFDAVLIACRRVFEKLKKKPSFEKEIIEVLKKSKLEIKTKVLVAVVEKTAFFDSLITLHKEIKKQKGDLHVIEGVKVITLITGGEFEDLIKKFFKNNLIKIKKNLTSIVIQSPETLEEVPGVMAYIYSLFGEHGVNIVETMSCWTDTILVVEEAELPRIMGFLKF